MNDNSDPKVDPQQEPNSFDSGTVASPLASTDPAFPASTTANANEQAPSYPQEMQSSEPPFPVQETVTPTTSSMPQISVPPFQGPQAGSSEPGSFSEAESYQQPPQQVGPVSPATSMQETSMQANQNLVATTTPNKISKFRVFIIVAIIAIAAIYSFVTYLYFQNKKLKEETSVDEPVSQDIRDNEELLPTVVPPIVVSSETVKIQNGNVVLQASAESESKVLVDKANYTSTGITGFARVTVSNDAGMLCFESWPPAPEPALFVANSDGSGIKEVSPNRQNCLWSSDNLSIFYTDYASKTLSKNIYQYTISSGEEKNMTQASQTPANNRQYEIVGLSADGGKLICKYSDPKNVTGQCTIDLSSNEVLILEE